MESEDGIYGDLISIPKNRADLHDCKPYQRFISYHREPMNAQPSINILKTRSSYIDNDTKKDMYRNVFKILTPTKTTVLKTVVDSCISENNKKET